PLPPPTVIPLTNGTPVTGIGDSSGGNKYYSLAVPAGATVTFTISGGTGDADLYTKAGSIPTLSSYDCRPYVSGNSESCTATPTAATPYYVMLNAFSTYSGVPLLGSYSTGGGGGGGGPFSNGGFETGTTPWVITGYGSRMTTGAAHGGTAYANLGGTNNG